MRDALGEDIAPLRWLSEGATRRHWRDLRRGAWSLVQHFDREGRRYLIAVRPEEGIPRARPLSPRERTVCARVAKGESNKVIAYDLGISLSTVAGYIATSMKKLGVGSRMALIARWNVLPPPLPDEARSAHRIEPRRALDSLPEPRVPATPLPKATPHDAFAVRGRGESRS